MQVLRVLVTALLLGSPALAAHFTGSYQDPQTGTTMIIQHGTDGRMQGTFSGADGQFAFQGHGNEQGAYGAMMTPQGAVGFQAQLGPDGQTLQLSLFRMDESGQPTGSGQQIVLRRGGGALPPGAPAPPGAVPGGGPGAPVPPGPPGAPGGAPGALPLPPGAFPPPPGASPLPASGAGWNGTFVGDGGEVVMVVQGQPTGYAGHFEVNGQRYPFQAQGNETRLEGAFQASGSSYGFHAERDGSGSVHLYVGETRHVLAPAGAAPGGAPGGNPFGN